MDFGSIFSDFSELFLTLPLPPQRLPSLPQAEMDLTRELFSVFVPPQHLPPKKDGISPRKAGKPTDGLVARALGKKFEEISSVLNESCQRLVDAASVDVTMHADSWEEIIDRSSFDDSLQTGTTTEPTEANTQTVVNTKTDAAEKENKEKEKEKEEDNKCETAASQKRNLVPSDLLKCASSRTLAGGDSYFIVQEMFGVNPNLLVTPSHTSSQGAIEIYIFDSGVVSIRTKSVFDIRSVDKMDGKEMVQIMVEHVMNVDLFHNAMRRHLLIESNLVMSSDMMDMMA